MIFGASWYNRGDESAIRAMIDELKERYSDITLKIHFACMDVQEIPYDDIEIIPRFCNVPRRDIIQRLLYKITFLSNAKINVLPETKYNNKYENRNALIKFINAVKWCDIAIYAPGGPNIGDLYRTYTLLDCIELMIKYNKPYVFFAPSMGPFRAYKRRIASVLRKANVVCLRENISAEYIKKIAPDISVKVTLDSAFQHEINMEKYENQLRQYTALDLFLKKATKIVGITITDLQWHSRYSGMEVENRIYKSFEGFIEYLLKNNYSIVFIPQLFGNASDREYMTKFSRENCFVVDDLHDCYFQQYLISKLYAVVGMRYHSNIFSAKMGTPFLSIAYEQKMAGFMERVGLNEYCLPIENLSEKELISGFNELENNYISYKTKLKDICYWCRSESRKTMKYIRNEIDGLF